MPEYLLHVLVTACKPVRCCLYAHIETIVMLWICKLQVVNSKTGLFENVLLPEGYILVLPGYTLQRATCGIYKAAAHRVVSQNLQHSL